MQRAQLTALCITNSDSGSIQYSNNIINLTRRICPGSKQITLGSAVNGNLSNLNVGDLIALSQEDPSSDTGNWWPCGSAYSAGDCSEQGTDSWTNRAEMQIVTVTGINGNTVTISPGTYANNWSASRAPEAAFANYLPVTGFGLENIQVNSLPVMANGVKLSDGEIIPSELVVWSAGVKAPQFLSEIDGLETNRINQLVVRTTPQPTRDEHIFAMGDCAPGPGILSATGAAARAGRASDV